MSGNEQVGGIGQSASQKTLGRRYNVEFILISILHPDLPRVTYIGMFENSVKRSDVTLWKQGYITPPPPYFILWNAVTSLGENKVI